MGAQGEETGRQTVSQGMEVNIVEIIVGGMLVGWIAGIIIVVNRCRQGLIT